MKRVFRLALIAIPCLLAFACEPKQDPETSKSVLGVTVADAANQYEVPEHQSLSINLAVVADPVSEEAYTVTLNANPGLVSSYNASHGTDLKMLPSEAYSLTSNQVMLPRYSAKSTSVELRLKGEGCDYETLYLLPIAIDSVQGGTNFESPDDKAAYIIFKMLEPEGDGEGTKGSPYVISDVEGFLKIGSMLQDDATVYFKLKADLDFKDQKYTDSEGENPWTPINFAENDEGKVAARKRKLVLDGNGHTISNFKAGGPLFGIVCGGVHDLTVDGADIDADADDAAVIVGVAGASTNPDDFFMKNVVVKNSKIVNDYKRSGALVAHLRNGVIEDCTADCSITAQQQGGGLIGRVDNGTILNCSASGNVTIDAYYAGGLVGFAGDITVKGCHASGNATSLGGNYTRAGGLIGQIEGNSTIEKCYATGNAEGQGHMAGGLIGVVGNDEITVNISKCYATGNVTLPHGNTGTSSDGNWAHAGGLLGTIAAKGESTPPTVNIDNCYATGAITVRRYSGGFVGSIYSKPAILNITNSYSTSDLSGVVVGDRCGMVIGLADAMDKGTAISCKGFVAWDVAERGFSYSGVVPVEGNYWGTQGSVSEQATKLGWDSSIWDLSGSEPKLK